MVADSTDIGVLLNLACLKYTGQLLPNCGDELPTTWKFKRHHKKIAIQLKHSPLYLRPSSNFSIELDIKRRLVVDSLKSVFSHKRNQEHFKWRYKTIMERKDVESMETILYVIGFTKEQAKLICDTKYHASRVEDFLVVLYKLNIPYDSKGTQGFIKLEKDQYKKHPEVRDLWKHTTDGKEIFDTYTNHETEYFEKEHKINHDFWYGTFKKYFYGSGGDDQGRWEDSETYPASCKFRIENPENYKKDGYLKKATRFQLDYLNRKFLREGSDLIWNRTHNREQRCLTADWKVRDNWDKKNGRLWLDQGKLDTETLLRVYAGKRKSYEDTIKNINYKTY